jgi:GMP synthase-like glutamine amidotransferase
VDDVSASPTLSLGLVDMNNGVANQATRCFRRICDRFQQRVKAHNPNLTVTFEHLQPRNLGEVPDLRFDLLLSSGGPGAPQDGYDDSWGVGYRRFLDDVANANAKSPQDSTKAFLVCHSFELAVLHFRIAQMRRRASTKFGVMPAYLSDDAQQLDYLSHFGYRLFAWEHRDWEAVEVDEARLGALGGKVLAYEAHAESVVNTGEAILGIRFTPGVDGLQFHPEADKPGVMAWVERPESRVRLIDAYGDDLYEKMVKSLSDPQRLARTFALLIPSWLAFRFNELAAVRGLDPVPLPEFDMQEFDVAV